MSDAKHVVAPSLVQKRSVLTDGARTRISLETSFWRALKQSAAERSLSVDELVAEIDTTAGVAASRMTSLLDDPLRASNAYRPRSSEPTRENWPPEIWDRWQAGEPMSSIGRRFDRDSSLVFSIISPTGGIRPPDRCRQSDFPIERRGRDHQKPGTGAKCFSTQRQRIRFRQDAEPELPSGLMFLQQRVHEASHKDLVRPVEKSHLSAGPQPTIVARLLLRSRYLVSHLYRSGRSDDQTVEIFSPDADPDRHALRQPDP